MSKLYKLQLTLSDGNKIETAPFNISPPSLYEHNVVVTDNSDDKYYFTFYNGSAEEIDTVEKFHAQLIASCVKNGSADRYYQCLHYSKGAGAYIPLGAQMLENNPDTMYCISVWKNTTQPTFEFEDSSPYVSVYNATFDDLVREVI